MTLRQPGMYSNDMNVKHKFACACNWCWCVKPRIVDIGFVLWTAEGFTSLPNRDSRDLFAAPLRKVHGRLNLVFKIFRFNSPSCTILPSLHLILKSFVLNYSSFHATLVSTSRAPNSTPYTSTKPWLLFQNQRCAIPVDPVPATTKQRKD